MLEQTLKKYWGYDSFRPLQKEIIQSVLDGKDTLGILPTGGGKSLTFQVPGIMMPGTVIVVTPLISLMKDQVDNLRKRKIKATFLHSGMSLREKNLARERIFNDKVKFLYISPERLASDTFIREIQNLKISLIAVDEAHCISQWGYDFRPSYLRIKNLRRVFPGVPVLALTASATLRVAEDICVQLEFGGDSSFFRGSVYRPNLSYVVRPSEAKLYDILKILSSVEGSAIVYVRSRKKTREIAEYLNNEGISATFYHAGLENEEKEQRQNAWKEGEIRVMTATNAFGMGIDKGDVRTVIHYDMPPSLEEYYQEAGRAGRDGLRAYAVLLTSVSDKAVLRRRITQEFPPREVIKNIYTRLCVFSNLAIGTGYDKTVDFDLAKFCRTFDLQEKVVRPALRILSQAGYVHFLEEFENSSRLMVLADRDELYRIKLSSPDHEKILTTILRNYPGLFSDYVFINEKNVAFKTNLDPEIVYSYLVELSKTKVVHYIPRKKSPMLYFPTSMEEERYVTIGRNVYEDRIEILKQRIEAMIDYGFNENNCRVTTLMRYFGESADSECGCCDSCCEKKKKSKKLPHKNLEEMLMQFFEAHPSGVEDKEIFHAFGKESETVVGILRRMSIDGYASFEQGTWTLKTILYKP